MKLGRLMRKLALVIGALVMATPAQAANITGQSVVLRTLDKVTATTKDFTVNVGDTLDYGSLNIAVKHCEKKPPEETPETYVFLQIKDNRLDGKGEAQEAETIFSGWMFESNPAISPLDHGVYDVWVIRCNVAAAN